MIKIIRASPVLHVEAGVRSIYSINSTSSYFSISFIVNSQRFVDMANIHMTQIHFHEKKSQNRESLRCMRINEFLFLDVIASLDLEYKREKLSHYNEDKFLFSFACIGHTMTTQMVDIYLLSFYLLAIYQPFASS